MKRSQLKVCTSFFMLFFIFVLAGCKGLFQSEPEDQSRNEFGQIDNAPAWSPDGKTIAYDHVPQDSAEYSMGGIHIRLIDSDGSNMRFLTAGAQPDWSPDGKKLVFVGAGIVIYDLESQQYTTVERYYKSASPAWSPDGKTIAYTNTICSGDTCGIWFSSPEGTNKRYVIRYGTWPSWSADGENLYYTRGYNQIWKYSLSTGESELVQTGPGFDVRRPSLSPDGKILLWQNQMDGERPQIWVMDVESRRKKQLTSGGGATPSWSPDGRQIAYTKYEPDGRIWIMNADGSGKRQLTY